MAAHYDRDVLSLFLLEERQRQRLTVTCCEKHKRSHGKYCHEIKINGLYWHGSSWYRHIYVTWLILVMLKI